MVMTAQEKLRPPQKYSSAGLVALDLSRQQQTIPVSAATPNVHAKNCASCGCPNPLRNLVRHTTIG